jgi:hypothetical protein
MDVLSTASDDLFSTSCAYRVASAEALLALLHRLACSIAPVKCPALFLIVLLTHMAVLASWDASHADSAALLARSPPSAEH